LPLLVNARGFAGASLAVGIFNSFQKFFELELFGTGIIIAEEDAIKLLQAFVDVFSGLAKDAAEALNTQVEKFLPFKPANADNNNKKLLLSRFDTFFDKLIESRALSDVQVLEKFIALAEILGKRPVLIIDEANKVLGLGEGQRATSSILDQIVMCTKELRKLQVIMASSEYAYPYLLEDNGLNLNDIKSVLFAGEIPPKSMWELLVTKKIRSTNKAVIGMGENLARLLIASYGGHFLYMSDSLSNLMTNKELFAIAMELNPISKSITAVLEMYPRTGLTYLRHLAESGFAPVVNPRDPVVEMIVRSNIGGVVTRTKSVVVGLPNTIWKEDFVYGLVPTSKSARNLIAINVLYFEKRLAEERRRGRWWNRIRFWRKKVT
jgi:hypothetical protein